MKTHFISNEFKYDGTQLASLFAYMKYGILGDSVLSWVGPCEIDFSHMVDGEDVRAGSLIQGGRMLHFIFELFDRSLTEGVLVQRLFASMVKDLIEEKVRPQSFVTAAIRRDGDDLFVGDGKLSISIATKSPISTLVHFALNITNEGTPVKTASLHDLKIDETDFAREIMQRFVNEYQSIREATQKVRPVGTIS